MNLKCFIKIFLFLIPFFPSCISWSFIKETNQLNDNENNIDYNTYNCSRDGALAGQIIIPEDDNYFKKYNNNIVIRFGGIQYSGKNSDEFEFYPDNNGCFSIPKNVVPVGSSFSLYFWDQSGLLNKRILPVYVSENANFYNVILKSHGFTSTLAQLFSEDKKQYFENTGFCGYAQGVSPVDLEGGKVTLKNNYGKSFFAKYFTVDDLPSRELNAMTQSGHFCFFNVNSCLKNEFNCNLESDNFRLQFNLRTGASYTFDVLLSAFSFSDDLFFDLNSSIFRPVEVKELVGGRSFAYSNPAKLSLKTSPNYSSVSVSNKLKNELVYFPLGNDLLTIDYKLPYEKSGRFYILKMNSEFYTRNLLNLKEDYQPGQVYVDKLSPVILKIFNPNLMKENQEYLNPLKTQDLGSVFLGLNLQGTIRSDKISVFLRDFSGNNNIKFFSVENKFVNDLVGFFYNVPIGFYQLFVINNQNNFIIYTALIQSVPNKTQVIIDEINKDEDIKSADVEFDSSLVYIVNSNWKNNENFVQSYDYELDNYWNNDIIKKLTANLYLSYLEGSYEGFNNLFNRVNVNDLCLIPNKDPDQIDESLPLDFLYRDEKSDT
ncbi:hypothetical protein [Fluviispira multicolorata]|uniref:Lipoprotein n=1 Tax=Fluviispira multicolorata TaxID=2654512 RepID=A0A833JCH9_9BACT|nr:hypothetical protein [Fluviispira multicolorata]KAB8030796.1 hypothetical protein GCL57_07425 [Fluviispira multicolorata]